MPCQTSNPVGVKVLEFRTVGVLMTMKVMSQPLFRFVTMVLTPILGVVFGLGFSVMALPITCRK